MPKLIDLSGEKFGYLVVSDRNPRKGTFWNCTCQCGNQSVVSTSNLKNGNQTSCGCIRKQKAAARTYRHGMIGTREYESWMHAKGRCFNSDNAAYLNYGGRGITMCEKWKNSFEAFYSDMGPCPPKYTLDRKDNDGNYEPGNCRWATRKTQNRNRRDTVMLDYNGETISLRDLAARHGMNFDALRHRYENGVVPLIGRSTLTIEQRVEIRSLYATGKYTQTEIAKMFNVVNQTVSNVVRRPENPA